MEHTKNLQQALGYGVDRAMAERCEFVTPEHLLLGIMQLTEFKNLAKSYHVSIEEDLVPYLDDYLESLDHIPDEVGEFELEASTQLTQVMIASEQHAAFAYRADVDVPQAINSILELADSHAAKLLIESFTYDRAEFMRSVIDAFDGKELEEHFYDDDENDNDDEDKFRRYDDDFEMHSESKWRQYVTCINDLLSTHNPLIGREAELDRTIQVLCRREKNNPLHVGEPGVGKTALVYGLAQRIEEGNVPERLKGCKIYQMDMGALVAGTQFRGDFEKRVKNIMEGISEEGNAIVYIDEIHTLVGAGATNEGALDGSNMLKPYLEGGSIRFIGSTTYKEFNRYFQKSQGMVRRFQMIEISEPSRDEAIGILDGLRARYEEFHGVKYDNDVIPYVVDMSAKYINDRFLPDKAIDLIDEAGAYREMHPLTRRFKGNVQKLKTQRVGRQDINDIIVKMCKVSPSALQESTDDDNALLESLGTRILSQIYGQDEAVQKVVEAVQMGKAGLLDPQKPIASMLFVGPTGVGKTEVCKVLAKELGIDLIRFDMSEYTEKHTVAKLIGSPAGYVGYEDGGLLTDAIRRTPHCVLLLDEIEKAHSDIYNILLQVMDYASLADNKGQKADFRHVILVMTSNAGAQYAAQSSVGFSSMSTAGDAMLGAVKKQFKPEFLGRLSSTVVFNDLSKQMARLILDKKLRQISASLSSRKVTLTLSDSALAFLLDKGFIPTKGARELDRVVNAHLNPLLTREILFGGLKRGGEACVDLKDGELVMTTNEA